jgi:hypothetical protein
MDIKDEKLEAGKEIVPAQGKKFKLKILIPPGQKIPVGIAS